MRWHNHSRARYTFDVCVMTSVAPCDAVSSQIVSKEQLLSCKPDERTPRWINHSGMQTTTSNHNHFIFVVVVQISQQNHVIDMAARPSCSRGDPFATATNHPASFPFPTSTPTPFRFLPHP